MNGLATDFYALTVTNARTIVGHRPAVTSDFGSGGHSLRDLQQFAWTRRAVSADTP